ncbi:hypothetical protein GTZ85_47945 [Streptomyces sp. SID5474]|nr:hypothetical protein [Streptomyces sp. SID5474]
MDVVHERCAGIDFGKADVKVCVRVPGPGKRRRKEVRTFTSGVGRCCVDRAFVLVAGSYRRRTRWCSPSFRHVSAPGREAPRCPPTQSPAPPHPPTLGPQPSPNRWPCPRSRRCRCDRPRAHGCTVGRAHGTRGVRGGQQVKGTRQCSERTCLPRSPGCSSRTS